MLASPPSFCGLSLVVIHPLLRVSQLYLVALTLIVLSILYGPRLHLIYLPNSHFSDMTDQYFSTLSQAGKLAAQSFSWVVGSKRHFLLLNLLCCCVTDELGCVFDDKGCFMELSAAWAREA